MHHRHENFTVSVRLCPIIKPLINLDLGVLETKFDEVKHQKPK